jgi:hypothetical protein
MTDDYSGSQNSGARIQNGLRISLPQLADLFQRFPQLGNTAVLEVPGKNQIVS